ncbi:maleylpyruvate isomerase family mycothiol-dependent enzyme [Streptomyces sp. NPDC002851]
MTVLDHDYFCGQIVEQTRLLRQHLAGADLTATVPTCPDWTLRELAVHVGGAHRWADTIVRTKATEYVPADQVPGSGGPDRDDPAALDTWLAEGAEQVAATLRETGPDLEIWTWGWDRSTGFWSRRMTHETLIHRADAALTTDGGDFTAEPHVAADSLDEWLQIVQHVQRMRATKGGEFGKGTDALRADGKSLHLHATDTDAVPGLDAEWTVVLSNDGVTWRRGHEKEYAGDAVLRGPLTDVLLTFYRRRPVDERVEVLGDRQLLDFWLENASFG